MNKWSSDMTMKFVQAYMKHECLWNFKSADYKDKEKREAAYLDLMQVMSIPEFGLVEVKSKIKNLRSTYNQEKRKVEESMLMDSGKSVYESNLKWLKDLEPAMINGEKRGTFEIVTKEECDLEESCWDQTHGGEQPPADPILGPSVLCTSFLNVPPNKKKKRNYSQAIAPNAFHTVNVEDSFKAFGNSVATQLRKLSEERALLAKRDIQNVLTTHGIEDIRERQSVVYHSTMNSPTSSETFDS
uniref:MADF domain-containing protein n=1 Tax=Clastoptera arizonana TaxID=38151 RepID=A0A1B6E220_9HEMI